MSKEEIEQAKKDAELYAEEDKKRLALVIAKNNAGSLANQVERQLNENKDKLDDPALVSEIEAKVKEARDAANTDDASAIESAIKALNDSAMKMGQKIYAKANPQGGSTPPPDFMKDMFKNAGKDGPINGGTV